MGGDLFVSIDVWFPDRRRRDLDNLTKSTLDAIQHAGVYEDDSQICDLHIRKCGLKAGGEIVVRISSAETKDADHDRAKDGS